MLLALHPFDCNWSKNSNFLSPSLPPYPLAPSLSQTPPQLKNPADVPARALLSLDVFGTSTGIGIGFPTKNRNGIYFVPLRYRYRFNLVHIAFCLKALGLGLFREPGNDGLGAQGHGDVELVL